MSVSASRKVVPTQNENSIN